MSTDDSATDRKVSPESPAPRKSTNEKEQKVQETENSIKRYHHRTLHNAVIRGDWYSARRYLNLRGDALSAHLSFAGTALHLAILSKKIDIAENLISIMSGEDLAIKNGGKYTAFLLVAMAGIKSKALINMMIEKNPNLIKIADEADNLPVTIAANQEDNYDITLHLYKLTPLEIFNQNSCLAVEFIRSCIFSGYLDIALDLIKRSPGLALSKSRHGITILGPLTCHPSYFSSRNRFAFWQQWIYSCIQVPSSIAFPNLYGDISIANQKGNKADARNGYYGVLWDVLKLFGADAIYRRKVQHVLAGEILKDIMTEISELSLPQFLRLNGWDHLKNATRNGIIEIVEAIIKAHPDILVSIDDKGNCPLAHAIIQRQEKILGLIKQFSGYRYWASTITSDEKYTLLHHAGELAPPYQLERVSGAALQFQREIQLYKEAERLVPAAYHSNRSNKSKDAQSKEAQVERAQSKEAQELFVEKHSQLKEEGEKWLKDFATASTVVASLIVTIMFAAIFTIPGGTDEKNGMPKFEHRNSFIVYVVSDAFSLFSATTSLLIFLGILTSRFAEEDFLERLPRKLMLGISSLFLSLASMVVAFGCTLDIFLRHRIPWVLPPIILLSTVPIATFVLLQLPLLIGIFNSTYRETIFDRQKRA